MQDKYGTEGTSLNWLDGVTFWMRSQTLSIQEIYYRLKACLNMCEYFRKNGHYYRKKHLYSYLEVAKEKEDEEAA
jgi:hypothetical protein